MLIKTVKEISLDENNVYIVKDGQIFLLERPDTGFGYHKIVWQNGKPIRAEVNSSVRI